MQSLDGVIDISLIFSNLILLLSYPKNAPSKSPLSLMVVSIGRTNDEPSERYKLLWMDAISVSWSVSILWSTIAPPSDLFRPVLPRVELISKPLPA